MELLSFQDFRLDGRVAFVTGAAQGMGLTISEILAMNGAQVVMCDLSLGVFRAHSTSQG